MTKTTNDIAVIASVVNAIKNNTLSADGVETIASICTSARDFARRKATKMFITGTSVLVDTHRKSSRGNVPPSIAGIVTKSCRTRITVDCGEFGQWTVPVGDLNIQEPVANP